MRLPNSARSALRGVILVFMALGLASTLASAATNVSTTFGVTATVQSTCLITATTMSFGTYNGAAANASSTVSVTCSNSTTYNVSLNPGSASGATVANRKMSGPSSSLLNYNLFSDSARTLNWGQTVGTDTVTGTGSGSSQSLTVYGQLPASQYVAPGAYADTITATVTY